ncbi:uncharacterized, partial [Tachysurus ichikawai]
PRVHTPVRYEGETHPSRDGELMSGKKEWSTEGKKVRRGG